MSQAALPKIAVGNLPLEVLATIEMVLRNEPYPFPQDGVVFKNFEGRRPAKPRGYYREYTVMTPGRPGQGRRRIVAGRDGDIYYTEDHYNSFVEVIVDS